MTDKQKEMVWNSLGPQYVETTWDNLKVGDVLYQPSTGNCNLIVTYDIVINDYDNSRVVFLESRVVFLENVRGLIDINTRWFVEYQQTFEVVVPNSSLHYECLKSIEKGWDVELSKCMVNSSDAMRAMSDIHHQFTDALAFYEYLKNG